MTIDARKITAFLKTISALADTPNLGSSALLKAWFDSSPEELRLEINGVIDDLLAVAPGASGADSIGSAPITGVTGTTVYAQLTSLKSLLNSPFNNMNQQAIINAAMEIWQQGTTFTNPANNAYTADMWVTVNAAIGTLPTTIVHSQLALTVGEVPNTKYAYNINVNSPGGGYAVTDVYGVSQRIEFGTSKLCGNGNKITISFYAKSSIAGKRIAVAVSQNYGTGGSPSSVNILTPTSSTIRSLTTTMTLYTFTFTTVTLTGKAFGTNNDDYLKVDILDVWGSSIATNNLGGGTAETFVGSGNISFTEVVVNAGDVALPFQPKNYNQELLDCQRYYEICGSVLLGRWVDANRANIFGQFKTKKRASPTVILLTTTPTFEDPGVAFRTATASVLSTSYISTLGYGVTLTGFTGAVGGNLCICGVDIFGIDARL